jgi:hypothetical protein
LILVTAFPSFFNNLSLRLPNIDRTNFRGNLRGLTLIRVSVYCSILSRRSGNRRRLLRFRLHALARRYRAEIIKIHVMEAYARQVFRTLGLSGTHCNKLAGIRRKRARLDLARRSLLNEAPRVDYLSVV